MAASVTLKLPVTEAEFSFNLGDDLDRVFADLSQKLLDAHVLYENALASAERTLSAQRTRYKNLVIVEQQLRFSLIENRNVFAEVARDLRTGLNNAEGLAASRLRGLESCEADLESMRLANNRLAENYRLATAQANDANSQITHLETVASGHVAQVLHNDRIIAELQSTLGGKDRILEEHRTTIKELEDELSVASQVSAEDAQIERELRQLSMMQASNICGPEVTPETYLEVAGKFLAYLKGTDHDDKE